MADATPLLIEDPALERGEWLFRRAGEVFGPVDSRTLAAMLYRGELDPATPVSPGDGTWRPVGEISLFVVHAKKAQAALRVEREVTGARLLRARRQRRHAALVAAAAVLLVAAGVGGGLLFWRLRTGGAARSRLLEDFGSGISLASAVRVGVGAGARAGAEDEIEIPADERARSSGAEGAERLRAAPETGRGQGLAATASSRRASSDVEGGELVEAQFDVGKIQQVVAREQRTLAPCFREEAERSPEFRGDVPLEFAVGNDGRVAALWIDEPRFKEGRLRECLLAQLRTWSFPKFPGQRPTVQLAFRIGR
ncbi:AgmX/PglI C-terminal domain-containing protein [Anaeromyxobacter oryzisoli]|uniref:AgmX/PglI C-terminal domain-containing protein n=1 Tax=Anaeromyxobacter oryzisoli TaxID=2925408 RepID=UPI001F5ADD7A|nr:AgmX/PglI C-terminal domain-containing protein [Anaeromyxobacter sp. SG63]